MKNTHLINKKGSRLLFSCHHTAFCYSVGGRFTPHILQRNWLLPSYYSFPIPLFNMNGQPANAGKSSPKKKSSQKKNPSNGNGEGSIELAPITSTKKDSGNGASSTWKTSGVRPLTSENLATLSAGKKGERTSLDDSLESLSSVSTVSVPDAHEEPEPEAPPSVTETPEIEARKRMAAIEESYGELASDPSPVDDIVLGTKTPKTLSADANTATKPAMESLPSSDISTKGAVGAVPSSDAIATKGAAQPLPSLEAVITKGAKDSLHSSDGTDVKDAAVSVSSLDAATKSAAATKDSPPSPNATAVKGTVDSLASSDAIATKDAVGSVPSSDVSTKSIAGSFPSLDVATQGVADSLPTSDVPTKGAAGSLPSTEVTATKGATGSVPSSDAATKGAAGSLPSSEAAATEGAVGSVLSSEATTVEGAAGPVYATDDAANTTVGTLPANDAAAKDAIESFSDSGVTEGSVAGSKISAVGSASSSDTPSVFKQTDATTAETSSQSSPIDKSIADAIALKIQGAALFKANDFPSAKDK